MDLMDQLLRNESPETFRHLIDLPDTFVSNERFIKKAVLGFNGNNESLWKARSFCDIYVQSKLARNESRTETK